MTRWVVVLGMLALLAACTTDNRSSATTVTVPATLAPTTALPTTTPPTTAPTSTAPPTTAAPSPAVPTTPAPTTAPPTTAAPTTNPVGRPLVMSDNGIGSAGFGADPDGVVDYVTSILGRPTTDSGWADPSAFLGCPGTVVRAVAWRDLTLYFGDQTEGGRRHFFGYTYGPPFGPSIDPPGVATDAGLTVGSTVHDLQVAYPSAGIEPAVGDSPANFTIVEGLSGYLTGTGDSDQIIQFLGGLACGG